MLELFALFGIYSGAFALMYAAEAVLNRIFPPTKKTNEIKDLRPR